MPASSNKEIISNTTVTDKGAKSVVLKRTDHEKNEITNGDKLKPYIVFPGHKREVQNLKKDRAIKIVATSNQP